MAASSQATAAAAGRATTVVTETLAGTRVLMMVDGYSKIKEALDADGSGRIKSERFRVGGHTWYIEYRPYAFDDDEDVDTDRVSVYLYLDHPGDDDEVKARYELALLDRDGEIITLTQSFYTFSGECDCDFIRIQELNASPLLGDSFQVMCDLTVVEEAAAAPRPDLHRHLVGLLASQLGGDVTFQVGGELFTAHKYILAARSTVFMAELFGPGKEKTPTHVRIDDIEPRVFRALLHFIYTDALPEMKEGDGDNYVAMAQGLLAAADRYGMEKLKSICGEILSNHINAHTAMSLLQLAYSHDCHRLKQACTRAIKDMLAKVATP